MGLNQSHDSYLNLHHLYGKIFLPAKANSTFDEKLVRLPNERSTRKCTGMT